ncbi:hypothetical protein [Streptomyces violascens]|uniref:hypothetical protein n=1 Tax=Streptomyces violascens TaxID=67381 RepID=UPI003675C9E7
MPVPRSQPAPTVTLAVARSGGGHRTAAMIDLVGVILGSVLAGAAFGAAAASWLLPSPHCYLVGLPALLSAALALAAIKDLAQSDLRPDASRLAAPGVAK